MTQAQELRIRTEVEREVKNDPEIKYGVFCFTYQAGGHFKYFRFLDEANRCASKYGAVVQVIGGLDKVISDLQAEISKNDLPIDASRPGSVLNGIMTRKAVAP